MRKIGKWVAITMGLVIAVSASGCAKVGESSVAGTTVDANEVQEITVAYWNADEAFVEDDVLSTIEQKLNIKIKPMNVTWDDYAQKIQLWASSGSLPDVFVGDFRNSKIFAEWATQGVIKVIPNDLSQYPNLEAYMSDEAIVGSAKVDGSVYCIPRKSYPSAEWTAMDRVMIYRWDLAQKAGVTKEPTTWEEFDTMIQAIMKTDPDNTGVQGMTATTKGLFSMMFLPYASPIACDQGISYKWIESEDGLYKPAYFAEDMLPAFQLMRDMYTSGTIEKDIALTNNQAAREKFLQGKSAAILVAGGIGSDNYTNLGKYWKDVHQTEYLDDVRALNLMPDKDGNTTYPMTDYAWSETYISSSVNSQKMNKIMELFDYLLSDEGGMYTTYGPEGELYDMVDGKVQLHEGANAVAKYPSIAALKDFVKWSPASYDESYATDWPDEYNQINYKLAEQARSVKIPTYNMECTEKIKELGIEFSVSLDDDVLNIMTGSEPVEDMWNNCYKQYQEKGLDDAIRKVNDALKK